jgi:GNAT superfamily N-acetyltransferase
MTFDDLERCALSDFQRAAYSTGSGGIRLLAVAGAVCTLTAWHPELRVLNQVVGLGRDEAANDDVLSEIERFYDSCAARFVVHGDVTGLRDRGYREGEPWGRFVLELRSPPATSGGGAIEEAGESSRGEFGRTCALASGLPGFFGDWASALVGRCGWHCFIARDNSAATACAAMFVRDDVGFLGFGATLPNNRRRGAQSALLARRIERARELGLNALIATTGIPDAERPSASHRNILRAGFSFETLRPNWLSP